MTHYRTMPLFTSEELSEADSVLWTSKETKRTGRLNGTTREERLAPHLAERFALLLATLIGSDRAASMLHNVAEDVRTECKAGDSIVLAIALIAHLVSYVKVTWRKNR